MNVCRSYESSLHSNDHPGENSKGGSWPAIWAIAPNIHCRPTDTNNRGVRRVVFPCHHVDKWLWYGFACRVRLWVGVVHDHMITCMWMNGDWSRWLLQCSLLINCLLTQLYMQWKIATCNLQIVHRLQIKKTCIYADLIRLPRRKPKLTCMDCSITNLWMILMVLVQSHSNVILWLLTDI